MEAEIKSLSMMPIEHKKRVFSAWEQMTYEIVKGDARISVYKVGTQEVRISVKIYTNCSGYKRAVNELTKAFINCAVQFTVSYVNDMRGTGYIYIIAEA